jgi:hypothetical protein
MTENPSYPTPDEPTRPAPAGEAARAEAAGEHAAVPPDRPAGTGRPAPPPTPWASAAPPAPPGQPGRTRWVGGRGGFVLAGLVGFLIGALLCGGLAALITGWVSHRGGVGGRGDDRPHVRHWNHDGPRQRQFPNGPGWRGQAPGYPAPSVTPSAAPTQTS